MRKRNKVISFVHTLKKVVDELKWFILISCVVLLGFVPVNNYQHEISKNVLRFHVVANSNILEDQQLKLNVRDGVIKYLSRAMATCQSLEDAKAVIGMHLDEIKMVADNTIKNAGYSYDVVVGLSEKYFPEKKYDDMTFPRGNYEALIVEIGSGRGRNWWCVLFPNLCFSDAVTARVSDESKAFLEEQLHEDAYESLLQGDKVQIRFKFAQIIADLFLE